jgi:hypothetical protein
MTGEAKIIVQVVISRLRSDASRDEFLRLTREMRSWLGGQPGFLPYELYEGERGWADRILWSDEESARAANFAFGTTEIGRRMGQLVDPDYRGFRGSPLEL